MNLTAFQETKLSLCLFSPLTHYIFQNQTFFWEKDISSRRSLRSCLVSIHFPQTYICFGPVFKSLGKYPVHFCKWKKITVHNFITTWKWTSTASSCGWSGMSLIKGKHAVLQYVHSLERALTLALVAAVASGVSEDSSIYVTMYCSSEENSSLAYWWKSHMFQLDGF